MALADQRSTIASLNCSWFTKALMTPITLCATESGNRVCSECCECRYAVTHSQKPGSDRTPLSKLKTTYNTAVGTPVATDQSIARRTPASTRKHTAAAATMSTAACWSITIATALAAATANREPRGISSELDAKQLRNTMRSRNISAYG